MKNAKSLSMNLGSEYEGHFFIFHNGQCYRCGCLWSCEGVYAHFLKDGEAVSAFVGLKSCSNAKSLGISGAVDVDSDGASLMVGDMGWVYAMLKRDIPHLIKLDHKRPDKDN